MQLRLQRLLQQQLTRMQMLASLSPQSVGRRIPTRGNANAQTADAAFSSAVTANDLPVARQLLNYPRNHLKTLPVRMPPNGA